MNDQYQDPMYNDEASIEEIPQLPDDFLNMFMGQVPSEEEVQEYLENVPESEQPAEPTEAATRNAGLRQELVRKGKTQEDAIQERTTHAVSEEWIKENGWVKLSEVADYCRLNDVPVSRLVKATGGDRALLPTVEGFEVRWCLGTRYLRPECQTPEAMEVLRSMERVKKVKEPKPAKEPKVKKAKKAESAEPAPVVEPTPFELLNAYTKQELLAMAEQAGLVLHKKLSKDTVINLMLEKGITAN